MSQLSKVRKSNDLNSANYKLGVVGQRVFILLLTKIDNNCPLKDSYTVTAKEYSIMYGTPLKIAYRDLGKGIKEMYEVDIHIHNKALKIITHKRIAYHFEYHYGEGKISVSFNPKLAMHLCEFKSRYTEYIINQVSRLKSRYSIRLYELLIQFKNTGDRCMSIEDFRKNLGVENKYTKFNNLKRKVIDPSVKELNSKTNLTVTWEAIKEGKRFKLLSFSFFETTLG